MRTFLLLALVAGATASAALQNGDDHLWYYNTLTGRSQAERPQEMAILTEDGNRYWVVEGEATWTPPEEWAWVARESPDGHAFWENTVTKETQWEQPSAAAWTVRSSNRYFYHNQVTKVSTREKPSVLGHDDTERNATYFSDPDGETTWDPPKDAAWSRHHSEEHGREYYANSKTKEVAWDIPAESNLAWIKWHEEY